MSFYKELQQIFMKTNGSGNKLTIIEIDHMMNFSRVCMINLCNKKYKLSNNSRWNIWSEI